MVLKLRSYFHSSLKSPALRAAPFGRKGGLLRGKGPHFVLEARPYYAAKLLTFHQDGIIMTL